MSDTVSSDQEKTYRAIGRFIFEFSQVEYTIRHYLAEEIGLKEEHFTPVVESYNVAMLYTIAMDVFSKRRPDEFKRIKNGLEDFKRLNKIRNRVAHGLWVPWMKGGTVYYVARSKANADRLESQADALEDCANQLNALRHELESAFNAFLYQL